MDDNPKPAPGTPANKTGSEERCWICGRSADDVRSAMDRPTSQELEVIRLIEMVESSKRDFDSMSSKWGSSIPEQFKSLRIDVMFKNPGEFRTFNFPDELTKSRRFLFDSMVEAYRCVSTGRGTSLGVVQFKGSDERHKALLEKGAMSFHQETGQTLDDPAIFERVNLGDGSRILRNAGLLYFETQRAALRYQMDDAIKMRPTYVVENFPIDGLPVPVSLCTICRNLVRVTG
jgi:hypothetical protein